MAKQAVIEARKAQALRDQADGIQALKEQLDRIEAKVDAMLRGELPPAETQVSDEPAEPQPEPQPEPEKAKSKK